MKRSAFATIDSSRLRHNLAVLRQHCADAKIIAVVKANAYGHGLLETAQSLSEADAFAVACVNEAIALRKDHCAHPVLCLQGFTDLSELRACQEFNFQPVIHQPYQLDLLNQLNTKDVFDVWLKVDTGMGRLGFSPEQLKDVYQSLLENQSIRQIRLMTHFANADHIDQKNTHSALEIFRTTRQQLNNTLECSAANSAALCLSTETHFQWVRPGLALYGISPFTIRDKVPLCDQLKPVMRVFAPVISIREFKSGQAIGYGGHYTCAQNCQIAVVAIGYCEGYPRTLYQPTAVSWQSKQLPVVGRVSMDMITILVPDGCDLHIGDLVEIWGDGTSVNQLAEAADTISYQILCNTFGNIHLNHL